MSESAKAAVQLEQKRVDRFTEELNSKCLRVIHTDTEMFEGVAAMPAFGSEPKGDPAYDVLPLTFQSYEYPSAGAAADAYIAEVTETMAVIGDLSGIELFYRILPELSYTTDFETSEDSFRCCARITICRKKLGVQTQPSN